MAKKHKDKCDYKLNPCAFGTGIGLTWALGTLILSYISIWFGIGHAIVDVLGDLYVGYEATYVGGLIGFAWGLVDGFIFGIIVAYIYNFVTSSHSCPMCCSAKK